MLNKMEEVLLIKGGEEHIGIVLGSEKEYFWLLVSKLREVYLGHPDRIFENAGKKYFKVFDRRQSIDKIFHRNGTLNSDLFSYSNEPEKMINLLKTYMLIGEV